MSKITNDCLTRSPKKYFKLYQSGNCECQIVNDETNRCDCLIFCGYFLDIICKPWLAVVSHR